MAARRPPDGGHFDMAKKAKSMVPGSNTAEYIGTLTNARAYARINQVYGECRRVIEFYDRVDKVLTECKKAKCARLFETLPNPAYSQIQASLKPLHQITSQTELIECIKAFLLLCAHMGQCSPEQNPEQYWYSYRQYFPNCFVAVLQEPNAFANDYTSGHRYPVVSMVELFMCAFGDKTMSDAWDPKKPFPFWARYCHSMQLPYHRGALPRLPDLPPEVDDTEIRTADAAMRCKTRCRHDRLCSYTVQLDLDDAAFSTHVAGAGIDRSSAERVAPREPTAALRESESARVPPRPDTESRAEPEGVTSSSQEPILVAEPGTQGQSPGDTSTHPATGASASGRPIVVAGNPAPSSSANGHQREPVSGLNYGRFQGGVWPVSRRPFHGALPPNTGKSADPDEHKRPLDGV